MAIEKMSDKFIEYADAIGLFDTCREQKIEVERAFYAGAAVMFGFCVVESKPNEDKMESVKQILSIGDELAEFGASVMTGKQESKYTEVDNG